MKASHARQNAIEDVPPMLVVNGCPRSGTSLIETVLARQFNAVIMPESHFIPLFRPFLFLWGDLNRIDRRRNLLDAIYDFVEIRTYGTGLDVEQMVPYCLLATRPERDRIAAAADGYPELVAGLFDAYRNRHAGSMALEKTAYFDPVSWDVLSALLPSAKFIHVIRDGRDVASSWTRTWFGPRDIAQAAWLWARHVREGKRWGVRNPDRYLEIHYEDFVAAPRDVVQRIGAFLGAAPHEGEGYQQSSLEWLKYISSNAHMLKIEQPIASQNTEKWRTGMSADDLERFEAIAGGELRDCGYTLGSGAVPSTGRPRVRRALALARTRSFLSTVAWKRRLVRVLPLAIWGARSLGLPLPALMKRAGLV